MEPWVQEVLLPIVLAMLASNGLWALIGKRREKNNVERKMLVGLAHDRIIHLGMVYVTRGYITQDEYENLNDFCTSRMKRWAATAAQNGSWRK